MTDDAMDLARKALDLAKDVEHRVDAHEDICAFRYKRLEENINAVSGQVGDIKKILAWAGGTGFTVILAVLGYLMDAQFQANAELQKTIQDMQHAQQTSAYERTK